MGAKYSLLAILRASWFEFSDELTLELMRWDAISCGDEAMTAWANGGECPFNLMEREFYFTEKRKLWKPGKPTMNHRELFEALCAEKDIKIGEVCDG